mmetsp:Transcript_12418/g.26423  ORF Transcript_12418/g.26423 Transcript_12418/m.26423 type:complete len:151 (-) Transcript_12418:173-625(-)|eukprot:CAMPEP_0183703176 /NCGR_PEP_ID=MMETSP0737-20130205/1020_1 /TAXON_ID=385413 /ORGANISM="Thalassiosira miniscula, Strain CCMP1093" /LENGTH=150 /DNA_ID=CAMNT_0025929891 /DNA_START=73 /DNA_END=525 /DNA_ORIENTATION=-
MSFELFIQRYLAAFDGRASKKFSQVRHLFEMIFHKEMTWITRDGNSITRTQLSKIHASKLDFGSRVTLLSYQIIGCGLVETKYRVMNELEDLVVHAILTIEDDKIFKAQVVGGISIAKVWSANPYRIRWIKMAEDDLENKLSCSNEDDYH